MGDRPQQRLELFHQQIAPILNRACGGCHGPDHQEANLRLDQLNPDLVIGQDIMWWLEIQAVLANGEMPPPESSELSDAQRALVVEWLAAEIQTATLLRREEQSRSSFRRLTRYELNYALQDLLALPYDFAKDLPPDPDAEDGFQNRADLLQMSAQQLATYREIARRALERATVRGEPPRPLYWSVSMEAAAAREFAKQEAELAALRAEHPEGGDQLEEQLRSVRESFRRDHQTAHYKQLLSGRTAAATWEYPAAKYAFAPSEVPVDPPPRGQVVAVLPPQQRLIVELGDRIPDDGIMRVRVRAHRGSIGEQADAIPSLQLVFGWQASNDSHASFRISPHDHLITATENAPEFYQWEIPVGEIYPRNLVRHTSQLGDLPSPSEYLQLVNSSPAGGTILVDHVDVIAPVVEEWPPRSHQQVFPEAFAAEDETSRARAILARMMRHVWRRPVTAAELEQKLALFQRLRPQCADFQQAMIEVLATVLSSPKFLYVGQEAAEHDDTELSSHELASRLAIFLWSSLPDEELQAAADAGQLDDPDALARQVERMLADPRARRFAEHFVEQWLGLQLLEYLEVDDDTYPQFDEALREAMREEPIAYFQEVLRNNQSVLDFLHANYAMVNQRLAIHYGIEQVTGDRFRRVSLEPHQRRGGLLTQAATLAMNSDGKDSHPLKRAIWLLARVLDDPPPPPPPAVPKIDLADPRIAQLSLKERMELHRNQAACKSCHSKIDPWGIPFENFDAVGQWRTHLGDAPIDANSVLFNQQTLQGMDGMKSYLLVERQDQFARAMVRKLSSYALGRPLSFADHAELERITAELRRQGDGLATLVRLIVESRLFRAAA